MSQKNKTPVDKAEEAEVKAEADVVTGEQKTAEVKTPHSLEITALLAKIEEYKDGWQRERADFSNYKRRAEREQSEARGRGADDAVLKILPIIDDIERGLGIAPDEVRENPWFKGIELLISKFDKALTDLNIEKIDPTGQEFDPTRHEAIAMGDEDGVESGHVINTLQKGYISGDRVLRPALVRVAN